MTSSQGVIFDLADTADARFDRVIEWMLIGLLAFMPLALGAVQPWSELVVVAGAMLMMLALMIKLLVRPDVRFVRSWAYVPMLAFFALVLLQLVFLPGALVKLVSPAAVSLRSDLLATISDADAGDASMRSVTLSLYPDVTLGNLRLLLAIAAIFLVTLNVIRRLRQVQRLLAAIAIIGTGVALLALAQNITEATKIYWLIPIESNQATSGPFVNHSHFAQFMNLSMGAALGLMLMHLDQLPRHRMHHSVSRAARALTRPVTRPIWMLACAVVAMAVTVPLSLSRGGMIATLAAGVFTTVVVATRRGMQGRTWIFVGIVLASLGVMLAFGFDEIFGRASSLSEPDALGGRVEILRGSLEIWKRFPIVGTGLGTFEYIFPTFDPSTIVKTAEHAENEYAQLLVETGAAGIGLMLAFVAVVAGAYARSVRGAPSPMASGAMGLGFGIVAILVHSAGDFGQHIPADAALTAVSIALIISLAHATRRRHVMPEELSERAPLRPRLVATAVVLAVGAFTVFDALSVLRADVHRREARRLEVALEQDNWHGSDRDFAQLILAAQRAAEIRPRDVKLRFELNWYRWKSLARALRAPSARDDALRQYARRVVAELLACPRLCPAYAPPYLLAGQIAHHVLNDPSGARLIRTAHELWPNDPRGIISVAVLEAQAGQWDQAVSKLQHAMARSADHRGEVIEVALLDLGRPDLALKLAFDDRALLGQIERLLKDRAHLPEVAQAARKRADQLLMEDAQRTDAPAGTLAEAASVALRQGDRPAAIELLRRATTIQYSALEWRLELARALLAEGNTDAAEDELRAILRQSPSHAGARQLLEKSNPSATAPADQQPATAPLTLPTTGPRFKFD